MKDVASSEEYEGLGLTRVPSLDTYRSSGSTTWESPPNATSIFGASHWPGISSSDTFQDAGSISNPGSNYQLPKDADSSKWDLEALLCGSGPEIRVNGGIVTSEELDPGAQDLPDFRSFPYRSDMNEQAPNQALTGGFYGANVTPPHSEINQPYHCDTFYHQTLQPIPDADNASSPHVLCEEEAIEEFDTQDSTKIVGPDARLFQSGWDCFVMETGSGEHTTPTRPRRRGVRQGRLPPDKAKRTAERRKQAKTCMRCRIARVEVSDCHEGVVHN